MESVNIANLKSKLSHYVRIARRGETVVVLDRETPVARLVPFEREAAALPSQMPHRALAEIRPPQRDGRELGSTAALLEERAERR